MWILISCICTVLASVEDSFSWLKNIWTNRWCLLKTMMFLLVERYTSISDMLSEGRRLMWPIRVRSRVRLTTTEPALVWCKHIFLFCAVFMFLYLCDNAIRHTIRVFALVWCEHFIRFLFLTHLTFDIVCWSVQITGTDMWILRAHKSLQTWKPFEKCHKKWVTQLCLSQCWYLFAPSSLPGS